MRHAALANHLAELKKLAPETRAQVDDMRKQIREVQHTARLNGQSEAYYFALSVTYAEYLDRLNTERSRKVKS